MPFLSARDREARRTAWHDELARKPQGFGPSRRLRLWLPVVISFLVQVPGTLFSMSGDRFSGPDFDRFSGPVFANPSVLQVLIAMVGPIALIWARRYPGPVVAIVVAAASADLLLHDPASSPPYISVAFAIVGAIARGARIWTWISVGAAWIVTLTLGLTLRQGGEWMPLRIAGTTFGILVFMGIGEAIRTRREHYNDYARAVAQRKQTEIQAERVRIARELHDVLAHSLSQINVQAGVGLHLMDKQPEKAAEALASIKDTSKTALEEVRSVLGILRAEGGQDADAPLVPEPDLARLEGLAASVTAQGVAVTLNNSVTDAPKGIQLAIYRIVQESLTNVLRHARARKATVTVATDGDDYTVTIADDGTAAAVGSTTSADGGGRGLLGMRERAELLGGSLEAGTAADGGFVVAARIPKKAKDE